MGGDGEEFAFGQIGSQMLMRHTQGNVSSRPRVSESLEEKRKLALFQPFKPPGKSGLVGQDIIK